MIDKDEQDIRLEAINILDSEKSFEWVLMKEFKDKDGDMATILKGSFSDYMAFNFVKHLLNERPFLINSIRLYLKRTKR